MKNFLTALDRIVIHGTFFLFPLFFLPFSQEFFQTQKFYLLAIAALVALVISSIKLVVLKKVSLRFSLQDGLLACMLFFAGLSVFAVAPNKVQSLISPTNGLVLWLSLFVLYLYSKTTNIRPLESMFYGTFIAALLFLIFDLTKPFASVTLSPYFQFLKATHFSTVGSLIETTVLFAFFSILSISGLIVTVIRKTKSDFNWPHMFMSAIILVGAIQAVIVTTQSSLILPPFTISWLMGLETLKNMSTALLGFGVDNTLYAFTTAKTPSYNLLPYWNQFFRSPGNGFIHIWVEVGTVVLLTMTALCISVTSRLASALSKKTYEDGEKSDMTGLLISMMFLVLLFLLTPLTQLFWVLFFVCLVEVSLTTGEQNKSANLSGLIPLAVSLSTILVAIVLASGYGLSRAYSSEYYFKKALDNGNSASKVYDYHRKSLQQNPYNEKVRTSYSQINLVIADSIAKKKTLNDQDKQTITQAIQASISEAKAVITLNPKKVTGWINLAAIYRNLIKVAKGADVWTVSAYQRAIALDKYNPSLRLNLGGVYYTLGKYDKAEELFRQTIQLKPNFANAHYNLAWAQHNQKKDDEAVKSMTNVLALIKDKKSGDYKKAEKEKAEFESSVQSIKRIEEKTTGSLTLSQPQPTLSPQIELPKDAGIASDSATEGN